MVSPNSPTLNQAIIDKFLSGGFTSDSTANPYTVPVTPYVPPSDPTIPDCGALFPDENRVYDPLTKSCVLVPEEIVEATGDSSDDQSPEIDPTQAILNRMKNDPNTGFGSSSILDDYITQGLGQGTFIKFDPNVGRLGAGSINPFMNFGGGLLDAMFMQPQRRENKYNDALKFMMDNQYGEKVGNDLFKFYNPQQYYNQVSSGRVDPKNRMESQNMTVGTAVEQMMRNEPSEGGGSPIAEDLSGGLLYTSPLTSVDSSGNRTRNNDAYRASLARNVKANPFKFRSNIGGTGRAGFLGGR